MLYLGDVYNIHYRNRDNCYAFHFHQYCIEFFSTLIRLKQSQKLLSIKETKFITRKKSTLVNERKKGRPCIFRKVLIEDILDTIISC